MIEKDGSRLGPSPDYMADAQELPNQIVPTNSIAIDLTDIFGSLRSTQAQSPLKMKQQSNLLFGQIHSATSVNKLYIKLLARKRASK